MMPLLPPRPLTPAEGPNGAQPTPPLAPTERPAQAADVVEAVALKNQLRDIAAKRQALAQLEARMQAWQVQLQRPGLPAQAVEHARHELQATEAAIRGLARALKA